MTTTLRFPLSLSVLALILIQSGCGMVPRQRLYMSQVRAHQLYVQSQAIASERDHAQQVANSFAVEKQQLSQALATERAQSQRSLAELQQQLELANERLANLNSERSEIHTRYKNLLTKAGSSQSPLSNDATRRFEELSRRYPDFEFDPKTGISKFHSDILFASGSDVLNPRALPLLKEFAEIMNDGDAKRLNILVVGHTDDKAIRKDRTKVVHPTNWHLSTNRANRVVLQLSQFGLDEPRMGAAGYSKFQPVVANSDESARQRNRRVEIFVLAPDAIVAGWDPATSR